MLLHLSAPAPAGQPRGPREEYRPSLLAFGVAEDHELVVRVLEGSPVEYVDRVPGPFPDEPDGTIEVGDEHAFTAGVMLRATGEVDFEIEHVIPGEPPEPEPENREEP